MKRLFTLRMIGIHFSGVAAIVVCLLLSQWQWDRAHVPDSGNTEQRKGNFEELSPRHEYLPVGSIGVQTSVTGTWLDDKTFLMLNRFENGADLLHATPSSPKCDWVVTPLQLADDSVIAVVRGCTRDGPAPQTVAGTTTVTGVLQPSEKSDVVGINSGIEPLTTELVVSETDLSAHDGYLVLKEPTSGLTQVTPILTSTPEVPLHWRNVFYTFNWMFFALVVFAMWLRVVKDELNDQSKEH
jgi:cytochrome oxidase assembly protein ShyY1